MFYKIKFVQENNLHKQSEKNVKKKVKKTSNGTLREKRDESICKK